MFGHSAFAQSLLTSPQEVNTGETRVYRMEITSGSSVDWIVTGGTKVSENTSGTQSVINVQWGDVGSGVITATETALGCPSDEKKLDVNIVAVPVIAFTPVQPECPGGVGSITVTNPSIPNEHYYQYQLEKKEADDSWTVSVPYSGDASSLNPFLFTDVAEGTYRVRRHKINKNTSTPFPGSETFSSDIIFKGVDDVAPTITCPADVSVDVDPGNCTAVVNGLAPTTVDNCGVTLQTWTLSGATTGTSAATGINDASGQTFNQGITTVSYIIEDAAGNSATCNFTVTIEDNEAPTLDDLSDLNLIDCPNNEIDQTQTFTGMAIPSDRYSDNCNAALTVEYRIQLPDNSYANEYGSAPTGAASAADPSGYVFPEGISTVYFKVIDGAGNESNIERSYTVTVKHKPNPGPIQF